MTERMTPFPRLAVALAYAFSDERHTTQRPAMARAADARLGEPGPLAGIDGAAEIAKLRQFLERGLDPLHLAVLYARHGQRKTHCKCCGSEGDHPDWSGALHRVAGRLGRICRCGLPIARCCMPWCAVTTTAAIPGRSSSLPTSTAARCGAWSAPVPGRVIGCAARVRRRARSRSTGRAGRPCGSRQTAARSRIYPMIVDLCGNDRHNQR